MRKITNKRLTGHWLSANRKRGDFLKLVQPNSMITWLHEDKRALLRAMSMTVCDLSAITKPWVIEKRVADLVTSEFFEQGDMERQELNITPIVSSDRRILVKPFWQGIQVFLTLLSIFQDIMNREKESQLPMMQVNFIDSICLPIYEVSSDKFCHKLVVASKTWWTECE